MATSTHAPGPWTAHFYDDIAAAHADDSHLWCPAEDWRPEWGRPAAVWRGTEGGGHTGLPGSVETTEANARLIAACPDLLEAALYFTTHRGFDPRTAFEMLRAAVIKAIGEEAYLAWQAEKGSVK